MKINNMLAGHPDELGAYFDGNGVNFALYSATAKRVELCLFDTDNGQETARYELPMLTDDVWHGYLPDLKPGQHYGYRVHGDYDPAGGLWFNPNKLLIDPHARKLTGSVHLTDLHFAYANDDPFDGQADQRDNAHVMPKCVVITPQAPATSDDLNGFCRHHELIYEAHVKGLTQLNHEIPLDIRGTYVALSDPTLLAHLNRLTVNCIELLPVFSFMTEFRLLDKGLSNYWGYNPVNFFCPHLDYALEAEQAIFEFQQMSKQLNAQDLGLILDVVYNHTAEGDHFGPILSYKGIDNKSYYKLDASNHYINHSGCGNTLNLANKHVLELVMSSMRYWVQHMGASGFRFDLATILGRDQDDQFNPDSTFFQALHQDPVLKKVKLIAEPWDIGPNGHQTGNFPAPFSQWNDYFRDGVREFWLADNPNLAEFASLIFGSSKTFEHTSRGRKSWASLNFITAHDGFTLNDLASFNQKHNQANQEDNHDGHNHNLSYNHGVEGITDNLAIIQARQQHCRNLMATLLLSQGVSMLLAGDEFLNSQLGNNNAYCQDNAIGWLDWFNLPDQQDFLSFTQHLAQLRKQHGLLRVDDYIHRHETDSYKTPNIEWLKPDATVMSDADWHNPDLNCFALLLTAKQRAAIKNTGALSILMIFNPGRQQLLFNLPEPDTEVQWQSEINTQFSTVNQMQTQLNDSVEVGANSLLLAITNAQTNSNLNQME